MKQSQVKPGVRAMLSLGHRGAVAVTVRYERTGLARLAAHSWPSPSEAFENWRNQYVGR
jgi:hypothetical protein